MSVEIFNKALKAHKSGDLNTAAAYYQHFLKKVPREYNALQLLGVVLHAKGDNENALKYMQASLSIKPDQPQVMLNVATCQRQLGLFEEALATFNRLIKKDPANFAAFKGRMNVLVEMKNYQQAYKELNRQINQFPGHYELYNLLGAVASDSEDYRTAITSYQKALRIRPGSDVARHNLGLAYRMNGESEKALKEYQMVLNSGKHSYQLMHNMGNAYSDIGHLEQAVTFYRNALKLNYGYIETHVNLNDVLWEMGDQKHYLRSFQKAMEMYPDEPAFLFQYVRKLSRTSQYELAKQTLESKQHKFGTLPEFQYLMGKCQFKLEDKVDALNTIKSVLNNPQLSVDDHLDMCEILIREDDLKKAESAISEILRAEPRNVSALAYWGLCLRANGDIKETKLNDYEQLVKEFQVFDPKKESAFYQNLMDTLNKMHVAKEQPLEQTLMNGTQTRGHLFSSEHPVIKELVKRVENCIADYVEQMAPLNHQWLQLPDPKQLDFIGSWSVRLRNGGFHTNHFHPHGKLSSVIYISLPSAIAKSTQNDGYLKFGEPNFDSGGKYKAQRFVQPQVGKLVVFPSYCWHGTQAFHDNAHRMTIAYDVA